VDWGKHIGRANFRRIGIDAAYTPAGGGTPATVRGFYQEAARDMLEIQSTAPFFDCMEEDVSGITSGATFVIGGATFTALAPERDKLSGIVRVPLKAN
jgi:hypothetical protein